MTTTILILLALTSIFGWARAFLLAYYLRRTRELLDAQLRYGEMVAKRLAEERRMYRA